jgi:hypothetical protein
MCRTAGTRLLLGLLALLPAPLIAQPLRDFSVVDAWRINAPGMELKLSAVDTPHGKAMCFDYDYREAGNFALVHQDCDLPVSGNFELSFWVRADTPDNNIEIKLGDVTGNTYWYRRDAYHWPRQWTHVVLRKRLISFAWGPKSTAELTNLKSIEFVVSSSGAGKKGVVYLTGLTITSLGDYGRFSDPVSSVKSSVPATGPELWRTQAAAGEADVDLTLPKRTEFGGIELEWSPALRPDSFDVLVSTDGSAWQVLRSGVLPDGGDQIVFTPDAEGRTVRIRARSKSHPVALRRASLLPPELTTEGPELIKATAQTAPAGFYPRNLTGQQAYWTLIGYSGGKDKALLCEDGQIELSKGRPSIDPFLVVDGQVYHWSNTTESQGLMDDYLPLPWMERSGPVSLRVSGFAVKDNGGTIYARYTVTNREKEPKDAKLVLALRPVQVNPEWQHSGVTAPITNLEATPTALTFGVDQRVVLLSPADECGATAFRDGEIGRRLLHGELPRETRVSDSSGLASAYAAYAVRLAPGESRSFWWRYGISARSDHGAASSEQAEALERSVADGWREALSPVRISLPPGEQRLVNLIRSNIAYIMINRDGVRLQPGSRNYNRSWIRDGALMSAAMMHFGVMDPAREFIEWYTPFVRADGYVPAIVENDRPLPTLECDSFGEYIYLVTEYWRFTRDPAFAAQYYPVAKRVADYIEKLHIEGQRAHAGATGIEALFYGLLPPSISHEGYGSPVHSYWDDYFAILGLKDAAVLASAVGHDTEAANYLAAAADLRKDVRDSIVATARHYKISEIASCSDYGETDASGVSILVNPCDEMSYMPQDLLRNTFDDYYARCLGRADGSVSWSGYTPYEFRNIGVFARWGDKDREMWLMRWFTKDTRPMGWNQWAEVVFQDARAPVYIGDMPHTWCAAEFVREIRDYFAYEDDSDKSLVLGSGVPEGWLSGEGIRVQGLATAYGPVSLEASSQGSVDTYQVSGSALAPGGVWLVGARSATPKAVTVNGLSVAPAPRVRLQALPARVEFSY